MPEAAARSPKGAQSALAFCAITVLPVAAACPAGPPPASAGSLAHRSRRPSGSPSDAASSRSSPLARWMNSRSELSAAPSAEGISERLDDGSAADVREQLPAALPAEQQVGGDAEVLAQRQVLPDEPDAVPGGSHRVGGQRPPG